MIETFPAIFHVEEILYELKEHCAGLIASRCELAGYATLRRSSEGCHCSDILFCSPQGIVCEHSGMLQSA
jgi:hypothetical protein